jgi:hypothetical protein
MQSNSPAQEEGTQLTEICWKGSSLTLEWLTASPVKTVFQSELPGAAIARAYEGVESREQHSQQYVQQHFIDNPIKNTMYIWTWEINYSGLLFPVPTSPDLPPGRIV